MGSNDPEEATTCKEENGATCACPRIFSSLLYLLWYVAHPFSYGLTAKPEAGDKLTSPVGWHTLPYEHDPSISPEELKAAKACGGNLGLPFQVYC